MTDATRAELLRLLERLSEADPDVRLGQLVASLAEILVEPVPVSVWEVEDDQLIAAAQRHLVNLTDRAARVA